MMKITVACIGAFIFLAAPALAQEGEGMVDGLPCNHLCHAWLAFGRSAPTHSAPASQAAPAAAKPSSASVPKLRTPVEAALPVTKTAQAIPLPTPRHRSALHRVAALRLEGAAPHALPTRAGPAGDEPKLAKPPIESIGIAPSRAADQVATQIATVPSTAPSTVETASNQDSLAIAAPSVPDLEPMVEFDRALASRHRPVLPMAAHPELFHDRAPVRTAALTTSSDPKTRPGPTGTASEDGVATISPRPSPPIAIVAAAPLD